MNCLLKYLITGFFTTIFTTNVQAQSVYKKSDLLYWQTRYPNNIRYNLDAVIKPKLTAKENIALRNVQIEFPLFGQRSGLMEFYSFPNSKTVVLPIHSIKFLDDICQAAAWLDAKGIGQQPLIDYVTAIRFKANDYSDGIPPPLTGLGLPKDPTTDFFVDDVSQKCLKSAILWILGHELGHIRYQHVGYNQNLSRKQIRYNESEADAFANRIFRRIGTVPAGMANFFVIAAVLWTPPNALASEQQWKSYLRETSHPIASQRLHDIANDMRHSPEDFAFSEPNLRLGISQVKSISRHVDGIAYKLDDPKMLIYLQLRAKVLDVNAMLNGQYASENINPLNFYPK